MRSFSDFGEGLLVLVVILLFNILAVILGSFWYRDTHGPVPPFPKPKGGWYDEEDDEWHEGEEE